MVLRDARHHNGRLADVVGDLDSRIRLVLRGAVGAGNGARRPSLALIPESAQDNISIGYYYYNQ